MAIAHANGVNLYYEVHGAGDPVVLVHGSWNDATTWDQVLKGLAASFRVLVYDRRGHSRSERLQQQGSMDEDGDDLADLLETLTFAPAHVVTDSLGGIIALRLAARRPELFQLPRTQRRQAEHQPRCVSDFPGGIRNSRLSEMLLIVAMAPSRQLPQCSPSSAPPVLGLCDGRPL
jgi:pimeloyl-ACP methyl ester carboxylesterase